MKTKEQVEDMLSFIGYFNDGLFMNRDYRNGIQDALYFVLYEARLTHIKLRLKLIDEGLK